MIAALENTYRFVSKAIMALTVCAAVVVLVQVLWISYGVFMRYVVNSPDRMVTEATALLLVPVAFAGLGFALREDAYPKVTLITERFSQKIQYILAIVNFAIMFGVGLFFSIAATSAFFRAYDSGAASEILLWPRYFFWAPVAVSLICFSLYTFLRLVRAVVLRDVTAGEN
ncbi:MAG: TRAP transporter small permease subunit [Rhodospirillales bacterium]|nr:TRAP transporter small permease subunit [Rhodospirillales bacterium]